MLRAASSFLRRGEASSLLRGGATSLQAASKPLFSMPAPEMIAPALTAMLRPDAAPPAARLASAVAAAPNEESDATTPAGAAAAAGWLWDGLLNYIAPKKRTSYSRKRIRRNKQIEMRGPKLKPHLYNCPVCERTRAPHYVCDREDCKTYFRSRWY